MHNPQEGHSANNFQKSRNFKEKRHYSPINVDYKLRENTSTINCGVRYYDKLPVGCRIYVVGVNGSTMEGERLEGANRGTWWQRSQFH